MATFILKKISELLAASDYNGLWTIGVDSRNKSVKISLSWMYTTKAAIETATANANQKAALADEKATLANTKAGLANEAAENANAKAALVQQRLDTADADHARAETDHVAASAAAADAREAASAIDRVNETDATAGNVIYYYINTSGNWTSNGYHRSVIIPVFPGQNYLITANNDYDTVYAFLTNRAQTHTGGSAAALVSGTSIVTIPAGTSAEVVIPETCVCLCFRGCVNQTEYKSSPRLRCPSSVTLFEHLQDVIDRSQEQRTAPTLVATGDAMTIAYSEYLLDVLPGRSYKLHVLTPDVSMGSITGGSSTPTLIVYYEGAGSETLSSAASIFRSEYTITIPSGVSRLRYGVRCDIGERFAISVELLDESFGGSVLALNPDSEFTPKTLSARKRLYSSQDTDNHYPLTFLHLSDIHGNWANVERFLQFAGKYSNRLDDLINTGDTVTDDYTQGIAGYAALSGVGKVMNVIGNHDTSSPSSSRDWTEYKGLPAYQRFIEPFVANWGVTQPENASTNGYCYYYKDYTGKEIRLIVVDIMAYDDTEDAWLRETMASAMTAGLHVVIAVHYAGARKSSEAGTERVFDKVDCDYTTLVNFGGPSLNLTNYNPQAYKMTLAVKDFLDGGGHFVGYLQGHYHADFIAKVNEDSRQLIYSIGSSKSGEVRDYNHIVGTRFQDEFQIVSIDTNNTIVKLYKVGANIDRYGRIKETACVDYTTGRLVGETDIVKFIEQELTESLKALLEALKAAGKMASYTMTYNATSGKWEFSIS